jgi:predicted DNA-binding transcriptional regulator AlpA
MNEIITGRTIGLKTVRGRLLKAKEVGEFLRVSERWVNKHMADGTFPFPFYPIGERNHAADSADLDEWLSSIVVIAGTASLPLKAVRKINKEVSA